MENLDKPDSKFLKKINSIAEYHEYWQRIKPSTDVGNDVEELWKKKVEFIDSVSAQNNAVVFLSNIYTDRCLYMSDRLNVLSGLDPSLFTAGNFLEYSMSRIHPNHLAAMLQLNQRCFAYCRQNNIQDPRSVTFCLNYLYRNGNDEYMQVLQRAAVLEVDNNKQPSLVLNFINYVGHIKKHDSAGAVILTANNVNLFSYNLDKKCVEPSKTISNQEKKIINLLAQGLDSKSIAKLLFISPHTVDTHRRNLIKKMDCIDSTGVVTFAKLINLI
jgi:DNA-binding CsgD family transcriptional regulator